MVPLNNDTNNRLENCFIIIALFKSLLRKIIKLVFSKKQFNARLTIFNVSLIFRVFATKTQSRKEKKGKKEIR